MTKVHFTWLGPPSTTPKAFANGVTVRPDIGPLRLIAGAKYPSPDGGRPPEFIFWCFESFLQQFRADLPDYVEVRAIEDEFTTKGFNSIIFNEVNLGDMSSWVDMIIRELCGTYGNINLDRLKKKNLAMCKDIWSMYCLWRFGGYHCDSSMFFDPTLASPLQFPEPTNFGAVYSIDEQAQPLPIADVEYTTGKQCVALHMNTFRQPGTYQAVTGLNVTEKPKIQFPRLLDVWLLRAPAGDQSVEAALHFYFNTWFYLNRYLGGRVGPDTYKELIVSTAMTAAICKSKTATRTDQEWNEVLIPTSPGFKVPSLGLRKFNLGTHRD